MKAKKKVLSILMALAMALCLSPASAFAVTVTFTGDSNGYLTGHTFRAYQIFSGTQASGAADDAPLGDIAWGSAFSSETQSSKFLTALQNDATLGTIFLSCTSAADVATALINASKDANGNVIDDSEVAKAFAHLANEYVDGTYQEVTQSTADQTIDMAVGYYLIKDVTSAETLGDSGVLNPSLLQVTSTLTIQSKTTIPSVHKQVQENHDSSWGANADAELTIDPVQFRVYSNIPSRIDDFESYKYVFHDDMSDGLDFVDQAIIDESTTDAFTSDHLIKVVVRKGGHETSNETLLTLSAFTTSNPYDETTNNVGYTLTMGTMSSDTLTPETDGNDFTLEIPDLKAVKAAAIAADREAELKAWKDAGKDEDDFSYTAPATLAVVAEYYGRLNSSAVVGTTTGNPNDVWLEYSNNPEDAGTGKTTKEEVVVFTYELDTDKVTSAQKPLSGAEFKLTSGSGVNQVWYTAEQDATNTAIWRITGTVATEAEATTLTSTLVTLDEQEQKTNDSGEKLYYVSGSSGDETTEATDEQGNARTPVMVARTEYRFQIVGLDADMTYQLKETKAPNGYNALSDPISITVQAARDSSNKPTAITMLKDNTESLTTINGVGFLTVENKTGSTLPETGAKGTMMLVGAGALVATCAAVFMVTRKKMSIYED